MSYEAKRPGDVDESGNIAIGRDFQPIYTEDEDIKGDKNKPTQQKPEEKGM